jgi:hypothetical protein
MYSFITHTVYNLYRLIACTLHSFLLSTTGTCNRSTCTVKLGAAPLSLWWRSAVSLAEVREVSENLEQEQNNKAASTQLRYQTDMRTVEGHDGLLSRTKD